MKEEFNYNLLQNALNKIHYNQDASLNERHASLF